MPINWPDKVPSITAGLNVTRHFEICNDGLFGNRMDVSWEMHWDSATGELAASGKLVIPAIEPSFQTSADLDFTLPTASSPRTLFLVLNAMKDGQRVFTGNQVRFSVR